MMVRQAQLFDKFNDEHNTILIKSLREYFVKKKKQEKVRNSFNKISKILDKEIKANKTELIKNIKIPLLVYTSKIIQDYQNGLGVFVSDDANLRFTGNGDSGNDILNTFSSGQLSAFVLAYMMVMNRVYTTAEYDLNFLLIDDPVQTMDDINIGCFVEILRNEFQDKQIILSTHEVDKENYILYKFLKYNLKGQSFNIKEKLYAI